MNHAFIHAQFSDEAMVFRMKKAANADFYE